MSTNNLYSNWRDFYAEKVRSWMGLEELQDECGKLAAVNSPSPELLLVHAMHALEELQAKVEELQAKVEELKSAVSAQAELHFKTEVRARELAKALAELITWIPSADTYRRLGFDPEAPMRALERAKLSLKGD